MKKILIVEDQDIMRENLATLLELEGFDIVAVADGKAGVEAARKAQPDLILCDVTMPELDGHGVLRAIRGIPELAAVPFLFLTARGEMNDLRTGMNLGADDYLVKPIGSADLLAAIQARLERQRVLELQRGFQPDFSSSIPLESLGLTPREGEVLLWVAQGKGNHDVGVLLQMSESTVKRHLLHIFEKLGVESRTAASLRAIEVLNKAGS
jgi:DNA-binding NarL/FixJ family response regulator